MAINQSKRNGIKERQNIYVTFNNINKLIQTLVTSFKGLRALKACLKLSHFLV